MIKAELHMIRLKIRYFITIHYFKLVLYSSYDIVINFHLISNHNVFV